MDAKILHETDRVYNRRERVTFIRMELLYDARLSVTGPPALLSYTHPSKHRNYRYVPDFPKRKFAPMSRDCLG